MKLYISSDIEGSCGITHWDETDYDRGGRWYDYFREQMTREVSAACEGAQAGGAQDILVKDAHDSARNFLPNLLPAGVKIHRGWSGNPLCMVAGLDSSFEAIGFTGYHSPAYSNANPLAHTMNTGIGRVTINGITASEFHINAYAAGMLGVPVIFLSGDKNLCEIAKDFIPGITTVAVSEGCGNSTTSMHPLDAAEAIENGMKQAVQKGGEGCKVIMPEFFEVTAQYNVHNKAYSNSFYPGAKQIDEKTIAYSSANYWDVLCFFKFCL